MKTEVTEKRYGSERASVFIKYLADNLPPHYTKMMKEFYQKDKKVQQMNAKKKEEMMGQLG